MDRCLDHRRDGRSVAPTFPGFNWSAVLSPRTIKATLNALAEDSLVNVLSSPTVTVMDSEEAKTKVDDEVPIHGTTGHRRHRPHPEPDRVQAGRRSAFGHPARDPAWAGADADRPTGQPRARGRGPAALALVTQPLHQQCGGALEPGGGPRWTAQDDTPTGKSGVWNPAPSGSPRH